MRRKRGLQGEGRIKSEGPIPFLRVGAGPPLTLHIAHAPPPQACRAIATLAYNDSADKRTLREAGALKVGALQHLQRLPHLPCLPRLPKC